MSGTGLESPLPFTHTNPVAPVYLFQVRSSTGEVRLQQKGTFRMEKSNNTFEK